MRGDSHFLHFGYTNSQTQLKGSKVHTLLPLVQTKNTNTCGI